MQTQELLKKISRGTAEIIALDELARRLEQSQKKRRKLRIKAGFDPTAPDIHLGHVVLLRKLRDFQDMGHEILFLIGDFTAQIGDPTGRDKLRPKMDPRQVAQNARTYKAQVFKILDPKKTKIVFNSVWLSKLNAREVLGLSQYTTVAQMLARSDFKKRFEEQKEISILEFLYPLLQGYDSVHLKADVELGGTDQKFNLLMGRQLQEAFAQRPQVVIMTPLLEGTDGVQKMSKSLGNYIGITESPGDIFGKVMSVSDELMFRYYELLTDFDLEKVKRLHPREAKLDLAQAIVEQFHSRAKSLNARQDFIQTFSRKETPAEIRQYVFADLDESLLDVLLKNKLVTSRNEGRRLLAQGAVSCDNQTVEAENWRLREGVLKVGKRRFLRLTQAAPRHS
jgi:tyrosyl-tRNA synthetase